MLQFVLDYSQKVQPSPIRPQHILPYAFGRLDVVFAKFSPAWEFVFLRKGFCLAALPHSPDIWRIQQIVISCTTHQVLARNSYSSFNVAVGLLAAQWPVFFLYIYQFLRGDQLMITSLFSTVYVMPLKMFCTLLLTDTLPYTIVSRYTSNYNKLFINYFKGIEPSLYFPSVISESTSHIFSVGIQS